MLNIYVLLILVCVLLCCYVIVVNERYMRYFFNVININID